VDWIHLAQDRDHWQAHDRDRWLALMNTVMNFQFPLKMENFLINRAYY
jgi:hypothetical protein